MGFWDSLFGGQNTTLNSTIGQTSQVAGETTGRGEKDTAAASDWWNDIISGDATKQAQALAPETSAAKKSVQQDTKTSAEMGTRSGGTAATEAASKDKLHEYITNLLGNVTGGAVSGLATEGGDLTKTGLAATGMEADLSQQRYKNWTDSILGRATTTAVSTGEAAALGA
jgi:hypothetical protein